ncbi:hypothetical protein ISG33_12830 [Glaciecola sp. MH2013]|uniref:hypothetical protein n=1 Tax=Glaciecola sp. MH2013 TaxID=2785524 RepID=UPI00189C6E5F|nr:hypothetical protein [Glaciecola sp. MH2013]MBF7074284.1 hypothetical protein [Glaciecola sp. MH2013]
MKVVSVIDEQRVDVTYNFTVADFHTYYVTKKNVLVHNCNRAELKSSAFGDKMGGSESAVKNRVSEAKVHNALGIVVKLTVYLVS